MPYFCLPSKKQTNWLSLTVREQSYIGLVGAALYGSATLRPRREHPRTIRRMSGNVRPLDNRTAHR